MGDARIGALFSLIFFFLLSYYKRSQIRCGTELFIYYSQGYYLSNIYNYL